MKRINVMVSDEAKEVLVTWKATRGCMTQDEALQDLLCRFKELVKANYERVVEEEVALRKEEANHIDELIEED